MRLLAFSVLVLLPFCVSVFAVRDDGGFRNYLTEFLNKYKGATEGGADGKFKELFPTIEADRKNMPGYTTCVTFQGLALGYATQKSGRKLAVTPSVYFFDAGMRSKHKVPPNSFFAIPPKGKTKQTVTDKTATYVDLTAEDSPRPAPGDLFLLAFSKAQSKTLQAGMFSHIGFITAVKKREDGKEEWSTVAGGGGSARTKHEKVGEGVMVIDPKTGLTGAVDNQPGAERKLQGWVSLEALLNATPPTATTTTTTKTTKTPMKSTKWKPVRNQRNQKRASAKQNKTNKRR